MINQRRLKNQFLKLVKIDSISKHEASVMRYLVAELKKLGLKPTFDRAGKKYNGAIGNLFVTVPGKVKFAPAILLNAHVDTVTGGQKIKPIVKKGIIYSSGKTILGADDKAGVAVILEVITCLQKNKIPHGDLQVVFTVAEEIGLLGARNIDKKKLKVDIGLVVDGGQVNGIINRAPAQNNISAKVLGKAVHAGTHPEDGISAIQVASAAIAKIKLGRIDFETTANIGVIKGGNATNIIPELVELKGEVRSHNSKKLKKQTRHIISQLASACKKFGARLKFTVTPVYQSFAVDRGQKVLSLAVSSAKKVGIKPTITPTGGGSDANIFNAYGIPSIIIGVGARDIHTTKEKLALKDLVKGAGFLLQIIKESVN